MKVVISAIFIATALFAQDECIRGIPSHAGVGYRGPGGAGYNSGYTTGSLFLTPNWQRNFQPLLDARVHYLKGGEWATNAGIGSRFQMPAQLVFGTNAFYDFRGATHLRSHQLGAGVELLHPIFDMRLNGYLPIGRTSKVGEIRPAGVINNVITLQRNVTQTLPHLEYLLGAWTPASWPIDFYLATGPYYFFKENAGLTTCGNAWGIKTMLSIMIIDALSAGFQYTYDRQFKSNPQGYVSISLPLSPGNIRRGGSRWSEWYSTPQCQEAAKRQRLMVSPIVRDEIVPICRTTEFSSLASFFEESDPPFIPPDCFFVDNSQAVNGTGTFDNPFNNLPDAEAASGPGDCIYVFFGDGTTFNQDTGITLQTDQILHGSAKDFVLGGVTVLPAQTSMPPVITNVAGDGVVLADGVSVIGLHIDGVTGVGIDDTFGLLSDVIINCNIVSNSAFGGLDVFTAGGTWFVTENTFEDNGGEVRIRSQPGSTITVDDNTFSQSNTFDLAGLDVDSSTVFVRGNTFTGGGLGGNSHIETSISNSVGVGTILIQNNSFTAVPGVGAPVSISQTAGAFGTSAVVDANTFTATNFLVIFPLISANLLAIDVTNNTVVPSIPDLILFSAFGTGSICANVTGNTGASTISFSGGGGGIEVSPGSVLAVSAANGGATIGVGGSVTFNATLPQPACTP